MPIAISMASDPALAPLSRAARPRSRSHALTPVSARNETAAPMKTSACAAERLRALAGELEALERRVDREEPEQPDGQRHDEAHPAGRDPADPRQPQHPERDRDDADVDAEQRHQAEEADVGRRRLDGGGDLVRDRRAGARQQRDLVRLALDPRLLDLHGGRVEVSDRLIGAGEGGERVVDDDLRDRDRVRARRCGPSARSCPARASCARTRAPRPAGRGARRGPARRARRTPRW